MRSVGLRLHHAGEPMGPVHQPEMADDRRLRQAGGAGRVDVERAIVDRHRRPLRGGETVARKFRDLRGDVGQCRAAVAMRPNDGVGRKMRRCAAKGLQQLPRDDDVPRRNGVDAMGERSAHEMGVEQRDDAAGAADAGPDRQVFGPVGHQQAHRVALAHPMHPGPAGIAVGAVQQRAEAQGLGRRTRAPARRRTVAPIPRPPRERCASGLWAIGAVSSSARSHALVAERAPGPCARDGICIF